MKMRQRISHERKSIGRDVWRWVNVPADEAEQLIDHLSLGETKRSASFAAFQEAVEAAKSLALHQSSRPSADRPFCHSCKSIGHRAPKCSAKLLRTMTPPAQLQAVPPLPLPIQIPSDAARQPQEVH